MEDKIKKCSYKDHKEINAIYYCQDCKTFVCNKCFNYHQGLFENHYINNLDNNKEIFIDVCKEKNHINKFEFYCKTHNTLCCVGCISKIEAKGYGQHKDCDICIIEDIKEEKKNKLKENIKYLEDISNNLEDSIKEIKLLFDKIDDKKEKIKVEIQNVFTKLRTNLNEREDKLLSEVDEIFNNMFSNQEIIKESDKLPNKIKIALNRGKTIDNQCNNDNNKLSSFINDCLNIEENIKNIYIINENIKKFRITNDININFYIEKEYLDNFIKLINSFGKIDMNSGIDSLILKDKNEANKFYELISNKIKIKKMTLLFRTSNDGFLDKKLNEKINNKSNLIFLFLMENGRIFGAYIKSKIIARNGTNIKDENAFVFSLNNNKIYKILIPELAMRFYDGDFIKIGNSGQSNGFWINSGLINENLLNSPKVYDFQKNKELTNDCSKVKEFEVFEINY